MAIEFTRGPRPFRHPEAYGLIGLLALVTAWVFPHVALLRSFWPGCTFKSLTGYPCATCGFTRAFVRGAHGQLADAFSVTPLGAVVFYAMVLYSVVVLATWLVPQLPRPVLKLRSEGARWAARLTLPALVLVNWLWLCLETYRHGAPPA